MVVNEKALFSCFFVFFLAPSWLLCGRMTIFVQKTDDAYTDIQNLFMVFFPIDIRSSV